jgi:hypothetical protein
MIDAIEYHLLMQGAFDSMNVKDYVKFQNGQTKRQKWQKTKYGVNGVIPLQCSHESLCMTVKALPKEYLQRGYQIVQLGHWCSSKMPYEDLLSIGNPTNNTLSFLNRCNLVCTELTFGASKHVVEYGTKPLGGANWDTLTGIHKIQRILFSFKCPSFWNPRNFLPGVPLGSMTFGIPETNLKVFMWPCRDFILRQQETLQQDHIVAWHLLIPNCYFKLYKGLTPSQHFRRHDTEYWNDIYEDIFVPRNEIEYKSILETPCADCEGLLDGYFEEKDPLRSVYEKHKEVAVVDPLQGIEGTVLDRPLHQLYVECPTVSCNDSTPKLLLEQLNRSPVSYKVILDLNQM